MTTHEIIASRNNPKIVSYCALREKKAREESGLFSFEGKKLLKEALLSPSLSIRSIFLTREAEEGIDLPLPEEKIVSISGPVAEKMSLVGTNDGIFCTAETQKDLHLPFSEEADFGEKTLFLSSVRDPGNLGTIVRSAYAFGIDSLFLSPDCADLYGPKTVRAAMGSLFRQKVFFCEDEIFAVETLKRKGVRVYATALSPDSVPLDDADLSGKVCLVLGNEGHGLGRAMLSACGGRVIIPMRPGAESLNVSSAAAVLCRELSRAANARK